MMKQRVTMRPVCRDLIPVGCILLLAAALLLGLRLPQETGAELTAVISLSGQELARIPLSSLQEEQIYTVEGAEYPLRFSLSRQGARVLESACPGQDCLHTGTVSRAGESIVCLPNRLILRLEGAESGGVDAVIG